MGEIGPREIGRGELAEILRELALSMLRDAPPHRLSRSAAGVLSVLERTGPQRITALAEREAVRQPSMTGLVQRLEAAGLVSRTTDPEDGRASLVAITAAGSAELGERRRVHDRTIHAHLDELDPDDLLTLHRAVPALRHLIELTETHAHQH